ncbi:MAG: hypothetical protein AABX66_00435 [Nanoarchaeota archaeon]
MSDVLLAVCDSKGSLIGYKCDSSWNLTTKRKNGKVHAEEQIARLVEDNLLQILNGVFTETYTSRTVPFSTGNFDEQCNIRVSIEESTSHKEVNQFFIYKPRDKYELKIHYRH